MSENTYIQARVKVNARKERITKEKGKFFITVKEKAERGLANAKVKQLLSTELGCNPKELRLIKGSKNRSKTYLLGKS